MNDLKDVEYYLKSKQGIIYNEGERLFYLKIQPIDSKSIEQSHNFDHIVFFDIHSQIQNAFSVMEVSEFKAQNIRQKVEMKCVGKKIYKNDFETIISSVKEGEISKAVWYNEYHYEVSESLKRQLILNSINETDHHLFIYWNKDQLSLTCTPELLVKESGGDYSIDCIASTSINKKTLSEPKFVLEHQNVVEHILGNLPQETHSIKLNRKKVIKFKKYFHWKSTYTFKYPKDLFTLIEKIAPTSAIFGSPTSETMKLTPRLRYYQNNPSPNYGGLLKIKVGSTNKVLVNIRNLSITGTEAKVVTGCGVVDDSTFEQELQESRLKRDSVLGLFCG